MDVNINLLSTNKRHHLKRLTIFLMIKNILLWLLAGTSLCGIILLFSYLMVINQFQILSESAVLVNREYANHNTEVRDLNKIILEFRKTQGDYKKSSPWLIAFIQNLPSDIKLNYLNIDYENKKIIFSGVAKTRSALINYQNKIRELDWIKKFEIPPQQLLQKEDIIFSFNTDIK